MIKKKNSPADAWDRLDTQIVSVRKPFVSRKQRKTAMIIFSMRTCQVGQDLNGKDNSLKFS